jgi:hypothetical protein
MFLSPFDHLLPVLKGMIPRQILHESNRMIIHLAPTLRLVVQPLHHLKLVTTEPAQQAAALNFIAVQSSIYFAQLKDQLPQPPTHLHNELRPTWLAQSVDIMVVNPWMAEGVPCCCDQGKPPYSAALLLLLLLKLGLKGVTGLPGMPLWL